jgi:hypothetical protein
MTRVERVSCGVEGRRYKIVPWRMIKVIMKSESNMSQLVIRKCE